MKKRLLIVCVLATVAAGCATPVTTLRHPRTGKVVQCGGGVGGSLAGGKIGYNIQKNHDDKCVAEHEAGGYRRVD